MKQKITGTTFILASLYYLIAEAVCVINFRDTIVNTYLYHTISELGIPSINSPTYFLMNTAFILVGLALLFANYYKIKDYIIKNKIIFYILTLITSLGVIIVGLIYGGNPLTSGYHTSGAVMAILGGNILLIITSRSMKDFRQYQQITLVLGIIGLLMFWIMFFNIGSSYMPIYERLSVYTLILWSLTTGIYLVKNNIE